MPSEKACCWVLSDKNATTAYEVVERSSEDCVMTDRVDEAVEEEVLEIPEILEKVLLFTLEEGRDKMEQGADVVPFTALVVKENLFIESHPGESSEECRAFARHTVEGARGAEAYAFCYDGYVETDEGQKDALIAEGGVPDEDEAVAVCHLYNMDDQGQVTFEGEPAYIGTAENYMAALKDAEEYADDEIDGKYLEEDEVFDEGDAEE